MRVYIPVHIHLHNIGNSRGSNLLTAQGNTVDIDECIALSTTSLVWIGLQRDSSNNWDWTSDDAPAYVESEVNWKRNSPRTGLLSRDCALLITEGGNEGQITNTRCNIARQYCCNPISSDTNLQPTTSSGSTVTPSPESSSSDCPRIRKEWNTATQTERDLYINGMLELATNEKLRYFTQQHGEFLAEDQAHGTSAFLPWHRYGNI